MDNKTILLNYIELGWNLGCATDCSDSDAYRIVQIIELCDRLNLTQSAAIARRWHKSLNDQFDENDEWYPDVIWSCIQEEIGSKQAILPVEMRVDAQKLIKDIAALFSPGVFIKLPAITQRDFSEAGKCIAYGLPTAAACLLMRGMEAVVQQFYHTRTGKDPNGPTWHKMVQELEAANSGDLSVIINNMQTLRINFRNPTMHPGTVYDDEKVIDLFLLCTLIVNEISRL